MPIATRAMPCYRCYTAHARCRCRVTRFLLSYDACCRHAADMPMLRYAAAAAAAADAARYAMPMLPARCFRHDCCCRHAAPCRCYAMSPPLLLIRMLPLPRCYCCCCADPCCRCCCFRWLIDAYADVSLPPLYFDDAAAPLLITDYVFRHDAPFLPPLLTRRCQDARR